MLNMSSASNVSWFETITIISGVIVGVIAASIKMFVKKPDNEKEHIGFIRVHTGIHETLTELRIQTNSDRTQVLQFHNGEYFMDGVSMRKFTLTHESLVKGVSADARRMTGLLCSMFVPLLSIMLKTDGTPFHINDLIHSYSKQFLEENNVQGLSILPIKVKGVITAFLLIQWCDEKELDAVNKQMASCHIRDARDSIEIQLSNQEKGY
jgi:hypothetical protein